MTSSRILLGILCALLASPLCAQARWEAHGALRVAADGRSFEHADRTPFFLLGDTAWLLAQKLDRDGVRRYFANRRDKGFNVVLTCLVQFYEDKNFNGSTALVDADLSRLNVTPGKDPADPAQYDYWDHVEYIVDTAAAHGIYLAMAPMWRYREVPTPAQAEVFIAQVAYRFRDRPNIIWVNGGSSRGGDAPALWNAVGAALKHHDPGHLVTFHPFGRMQSSSWFHDQPWLDFNMFVSGHRRYDQDNEAKAFGEDNWRYVLEDLAKTPRKPTLDGEASYENTPQGLHDVTQPYWGAADARRYAWWSVFAGAAGHVYGENSVRQIYLPADTRPASGAQGYFFERLETEGSAQMKHLASFVLSRPPGGRVNDQSLVAGDEGEKYGRIIALRGQGWIAAYNYTGRDFNLRLDGSIGRRLAVSWLNPRTGMIIRAGTRAGIGTARFHPPGKAAPGNDWVLILDGSNSPTAHVAGGK